MKMNGRKLDTPVIETLVIPRSDGDLVFRAAGIKSYNDFDALCPRPLAPTIIKASGETLADVEDADFKSANLTWAENRMNWMILKSLEATPDLEWETVNKSDSSTWGRYTEELEQSNLKPSEVMRIIQLAISANGLDQSKIDQATESFLAGEAAARKKQ